MPTLLPAEARQARAFGLRLFEAAVGAAELMAAYIGMRLGFYRSLSEDGDATAPELAARTGVDVRYAREWLEQQATAGVLTVDDIAGAPDARSYRLPPAHAAALADDEAPFSMAALALLPVGGVAPLVPDLIEAYRTGAGIPYSAYGEVFREAQESLNRAVLTHNMPAWVAATLPDLHERLSGEGGRIADVACGAGWSSIALATAYPSATVDGIDLDAPSVGRARHNAAAAGVADRASFVVADAADEERAGQYDLVCVFDALHDMARPVEVLAACRQLRAAGGTVLLMEPAAEESLTAPGGGVERLLYAISLLHCLPVGRSDHPSAATGTVLRPQVLRQLALAAGFAGVDVLPVEHRFHRLYRLHG